jgi:hypothetical protein
MNVRRFLSYVLILIALSLSTTSNAMAASPGTWSGTVGGVTVHAYKYVYLDSYSWSTSLYSTANSTINIIGYTYWTFGEYCPSTQTWASYYYYDGDYDTYDSYYATYGSGIQYQGCSGTSRHRSLGNHDFANGNDHIYPYVEAYLDR